MDSADPLSELADIHLPAEVGFWPPAPGWWVLLALLLAGLLWLAIIMFRRWRRQRYYQFALSELDKCYQRHAQGAQGSDRDLDLVNNVNAVLRRVALRHFPQEPVAGLTGRAWVGFIRSHGDATLLDDELAGVLAHGRFAADCSVNPDALHAMAQQWIKSLYLNNLYLNKKPGDGNPSGKLARIDNQSSSNAAPEHA